MQDDDTNEPAGDSNGRAADVSAENVDFGDYTVVGTGVQIMLGGRSIVHPGE